MRPAQSLITDLSCERFAAVAKLWGVFDVVVAIADGTPRNAGAVYIFVGSELRGTSHRPANPEFRAARKYRGDGAKARRRHQGSAAFGQRDLGRRADRGSHRRL